MGRGVRKFQLARLLESQRRTLRVPVERRIGRSAIRLHIDERNEITLAVAVEIDERELRRPVEVDRRDVLEEMGVLLRNEEKKQEGVFHVFLIYSKRHGRNKVSELRRPGEGGDVSFLREAA